MMINCTIKGGVRGKGFIMYNVVDNTGDIIEMAPGDVRADVFSVPDKHTPMRTNFLTTDSGKAWKEEREEQEEAQQTDQVAWALSVTRRVK